MTPDSRQIDDLLRAKIAAARKLARKGDPIWALIEDAERAIAEQREDAKQSLRRMLSHFVREHEQPTAEKKKWNRMTERAKAKRKGR